MFKQYAILPIESQSFDFEGTTFMSQNVEDILIVQVPENSDKGDLGLMREKLQVAFPDRTIIIIPDSVKFCRIKEVAEDSN